MGYNDSSQFARHMPLLNNNGGYQSEDVVRVPGQGSTSVRGDV